MKKEKNTKNNEVVDENVIELSELNALKPEEVVDVKKEVENGTDNESEKKKKEFDVEFVYLSPRVIESWLSNAFTCRKAHLLEVKQIPSVGVFDEVIWEAFGGNTCDLDSIWEEMRQDCSFTRSDFQRVRTVSGNDV
ncbi:hypothetical protein Tco_0401498 [Tanacetum coccineum]